MSYGMEVADLSGDGALDLAIIYEFQADGVSHEVDILLNRETARSRLLARDARSGFLGHAEARAGQTGKHAGVLIVRLPDSEQWRVGDHLVGWFSDPDARTWERCMVVATLLKVRVVRGATAQR